MENISKQQSYEIINKKLNEYYESDIDIYGIYSIEDLQEAIKEEHQTIKEYIKRLKGDDKEIKKITDIINTVDSNIIEILKNVGNDNLEDMKRLFLVNNATHLRYANPTFVLTEPEGISTVVKALKDFTTSKIEESNNKNSNIQK